MENEFCYKIVTTLVISIISKKACIKSKKIMAYLVNFGRHGCGKHHT